MDALLKQEVHQLIDQCDDDSLLREAKNILNTKNSTDWWDELSEQQQTELNELLNEPDDKDVVTEETYLNLTARWRTK
jgi:transcriptional regulator of heat shock response